MHFSYQSPMQYPNQFSPAYPPVSTPAGRRAAVMMWALGGLLLLTAGTSCIGSILLTPDQFHQTFQEQMKVAADNKIATAGMPMSESAFHTFNSILYGIVAVVGLVVALLGFGVRRGRRGQTVAATVVVSVGAAILALFILMFFVMGLMSPILLGGAFLMLMIASPVFLLVFWLFSALRRPEFGGSAPQPQMWPTMPPVHGPAWSPYAPPMTGYGGMAGYGVAVQGYGVAVPGYGGMPGRPVMAPPVVSVLGYGYPGIAPPAPPPPQGFSPVLPTISNPGPSPTTPPAPPADSATPSH